MRACASCSGSWCCCCCSAGGMAASALARSCTAGGIGCCCGWSAPSSANVVTTAGRWLAEAAPGSEGCAAPCKPHRPCKAPASAARLPAIPAVPNGGCCCCCLLLPPLSELRCPSYSCRLGKAGGICCHAGGTCMPVDPGCIPPDVGMPSACSSDDTCKRSEAHVSTPPTHHASSMGLASQQVPLSPYCLLLAAVLESQGTWYFLHNIHSSNAG
jgi:hypothetical protein